MHVPAALSASSWFFFFSRLALVFLEIPLERWGFVIPRDRDVLGKLAMERMEDKQGEGGSFTQQSWQNLWKRDNQQSKAAKEVVLAAGAPPTPTTKRWVE